MKKTSLVTSLLVLIILAATSCQKDNGNINSSSMPTSVQNRGIESQN